jgi:hypothetical protein
MQVRRVTPIYWIGRLIAEHARRKTIIIRGRPSLPGLSPPPDPEDARVDRMINSICRGC